MAHHPEVTRAYGAFEGKVAKWKRLDTGLKDLADLGSAATIGCQWCLDFGYWVMHTRGVAREKIEAVPRWRDSDLFTPVERLVLEYAEAMTVTPPTVDDDLVARLREHLDEAALVELTMTVAVENVRSRFNSAMGLSGQGFKERCDLPAAAQPSSAESPAASASRST